MNVTEGWVKQKNLEERPISEWEQGKWKFQIIIDQKNWQRYHIMFDIVGGEIRVFHVGPGG